MFSIRQLSQLLGISSQTIRLYEQQGIFHAERSGANYRKFDYRAVTTLMKCRKLMGMGFSIRQIADISKGISYQDGQRMLRQQADDIEKEIRLLINKRKGIAHMYDLMRNIQNRRGTCEVVMSPDVYSWTVIRNGKLLIGRDTATLNKWNECSFIRYDVKRFPLETLMDGKETTDFAMEYCARAEDAARVGLDVSQAKLYPAQPFLMAYATCPADQLRPLHEMFGFMAEYIRARSLTPVGDPMLFMPFWPQQGSFELHFVMGVYVDRLEDAQPGNGPLAMMDNGKGPRAPQGV